MKKVFLICSMVATLTLLFIYRDTLNVTTMLQWFESVKTSPFAPVIFVLLYAFAVTFVFPASAFTLISGPLFGFWGGLLLTTIAANLGCHLSYAIAKFLGKETITKYIKAGSFLDEAQQKAQKNGFVFMMYARLIPLFPFAAVNYLSGVIGISYKHYALATFLGMIPGSIVYVYLGYSASNIKDNPLAFIVSLAILVIFTVTLIIIKKRQATSTPVEEQK